MITRWPSVCPANHQNSVLPCCHLRQIVSDQSKPDLQLEYYPPKAVPELWAEGLGQVFTWDITRLKGPGRGEYFPAYVIIDIYSRYVAAHTVKRAESGKRAAELITDLAAANGIAPAVLHADRGAAMTSKEVCQLLLDLGIERSHSRPKTSNDNPYSEAHFKTVKYASDYPDRFASLAQARE